MSLEPPPLLETPPAPSAPAVAFRPAQPKTRSHIVAGLILIALSCLMLGYVSWVEEAWIDSVPWGNSLARVDDNPVKEGARPAQIRKIPTYALPPDTPLVDAVRRTFREAGVSSTEAEPIVSLLGGSLAESVLFFPATEEELSKVIERGRAPRPGAPEVLAGELARMDSFELDGEIFQVVGHIKQGVGAATFAYWLPEEPTMAARHFSAAQEAKPGWFAPDARLLPRTKKAKGIIEKEKATAEAEAAGEDAEAVGDFSNQPVAQVPTRTAYAAGSLLAMILGAVGGYLLHRGLFVRWAAQGGLFGSIFGAVAARPRLFEAMHLLLYGAFFFAMFRGWQLPLNNIAIGQFVAGEFTTGGLQYVGQAYASGHIARAAAATFFNNYVMQTLLLTFILSLVPLMPGLFKTIASFVLTGFTMVPIWTGTASGYTYHVVTMVFELEAYIVACFAVYIWTASLYRWLISHLTVACERPSLRNVFAMYAEAAVLSGVMLALAAGYEAATLILFSGH